MTPTHKFKTRILLDFYPDDRLGNQFVGHIYFAWEQYEKAVKYYDLSIHQKNDRYYTYYYGAMAHSHLGEYKKAQELLELYLKNYRYVDYLQLALAWIHVLQGDYEQALEEVEIARAHDPENPRVIVEKGNILICMGSLKEAEAIFQGLLERKDIMPNPGMKPLYDLYLLRGKFSECEEMLREAVFPVDRDYLYMRMGNLGQALVEAKQYPLTQFIPYNEGTVYVEMGSLDKAQEALQALGRIKDERFEKSRFTYLEKHHKDLSGRIELSRKNFPVAIRFFKDANTRLSEESFLESGRGLLHAWFFEALARAYYESGDLINAAVTYTDITELTLGRLEFGGIYARAFLLAGENR